LNYSLKTLQQTLLHLVRPDTPMTTALADYGRTTFLLQASSVSEWFSQLLASS